ncbi:MAG: toll/interleukin-1 receptor domain-containing protein, partial [Cyanobacteria bacterium J06597_1]
MAKVFISFVHRDRDFVQNIQEALINVGHEVWRYDELIDAGQSFHEKIDSAVRNADAIIAVISESSSSNTWINQ